MLSTPCSQSQAPPVTVGLQGTPRDSVVRGSLCQARLRGLWVGVSPSPALSPAPPLLLPVSHQEPPWECLEVFAAVAPAPERTGAPKLSQALQVKGVCGLCPVPLPLLLSGDGLAVRAPSVTWARGRQCLSVAGLLPSSPSRLSLPFHTGAHRWVLLCTGQHSWAHIEPSRLGAPLLAGGPGTASLRKGGL